MTEPALLSEIESGTKVGQIKSQIIAYCIEHGPSTITDLAHYLMLSTPTVTKFITELENKKCIANYGKLETNGGRYPYIYGLHPEAGIFIGVDVQHDRVHVGLMNLVGAILVQEYDIPYILNDDASSIAELCTLIRNFITDHQIDTSNLLNININLPGRINPMTGYSYTFFQQIQKKQSLADIIGEELGFNVTLDNDTRGMAYGEYTQGVTAGTEAKNVLYINMSWGLGLGIILNGKIYTGKSGFSGEFGHISIYDNEILCPCGKKGCMQTEIGGLALHRVLTQRIAAGEVSVLSDLHREGKVITLPDIINAINNEDVLCLEVLDSVGRKLGRQLAGLINIFNPEVVILGGTLAETGEFLRLPVETIVRTYTLNVVSNDTSIKIASLGKEAGLIGSCMMARSRRFGKIG
ncbi:MAG: ROK family transcriptional regulator [Bacteroidales bacterium]|nr:ROK family transcriptional regulator [Porphyromonas sp.]MDD6934647.1 ROK family transcriptional regulator [Bacteroidales bacterium]MDY3102663.1 ROK family transcriptional regulator [Porphyromonas sp.]